MQCRSISEWLQVCDSVLNSLLQIELADLRSLLTDLENRNEAQAANIESLTSTLETKDGIIWVNAVNMAFLLAVGLHCI